MQPDTRKKVRMLLADWGRAMERVRAKQEQLDSILLLMRIGTSSRPMDGMPHGTATSDPTPSQAEWNAKLKELYTGAEGETANAIDDILQQKFAIDALVDALPQRHRRVLRLKYEGQRNITQIANELRYAVDTVYHIEMDAVDRLGHRLKFEDK
jgi:DNA-directed RNA polymerase specialized sigma24 family protein